jgi:hypothetical protein
MNTSEHQATAGEPVTLAGYEHMRPSGTNAAPAPAAGASAAATPPPAPIPKGYAPVSAAQRAAATKPLNVGEFLLQQRQTAPAPDATPAPSPDAAAPPAEEPGLNYKDAWDEGGTPPEPEPASFDKYRYGRGHSIEVPEMLAKDTRFEEAEIKSVARDAGIAASHAGISAEATEAIFDIVSTGYEPPPEGGFDLDRGLSGLRLIAGEQTDALIEKVQRYVKERPALASYLDETTLGNHPQMLLALGAIATRPSLQTKAGAQAYLAELRNPATEVSKRYFGGDKFEVFVAKIAFGVAYSGERRLPVS